ncbi:MAG: ORF6N domain-containing protein [Elusimicrobiales bacterium]|nr:ORF6N domain-containing protein [Elusimicrobiales bacterium]
MKNLISQNQIESKILLIKGHKIMLDRDLAELYGVTTSNLNKAVKRNKERFPIDFMFQLTKEEFTNLRFQFGTSSYGGRRYLPYVFTEQGVSMLSTVLNSKRAVQVNIAIMRVFVNIRNLVSTNKEILNKLNRLENKYEKHDEQIYAIFEQIREFLTFNEKPKKQIGFKSDKSLKRPQNKKLLKNKSKSFKKTK